MSRTRGFRSTPSEAFKRAMGRMPQRVNPFTQQVQKTAGPLDAGALYHYWYPGRDGVEQAPPDVQARLLDIGGTDDQGQPKLACVRPPANAPIRCRCWLVFYRKQEVTHWLSPGWLMILAWHNGAEPHPAPLPIDNRLYANLVLQSLKGGRAIFGRDFDNAREYFDQIVKVMLRDKEKAESVNQQYLDDRRKDFYGYTKIKNIGHGSKFALHHDGTVVPERGERNWLRERELPLPGDVQARVASELKVKTQTAVHADTSVLQRERVKQTAALMQEINRMKSRVSVGIARRQDSPLERRLK